MSELEYPLEVFTDAVIGANGIGGVSVGPDAPFERWVITSTQISNNGSGICKMEIHNNPTYSQLIESTLSGKLDNSDTQFKLDTGRRIYFRWLNATPGSRSTVTVRGTKYVQRR